MRILRCCPPGAPASEIRIGRGLAANVPGWAGGRSVFALVDRAVQTSPALAHDWPRILAEPGDAQKSLAACESVLHAMAAAGIDRGGLLLALGGGAVGDAGGFCASVYLRGIELWQVPTTLLSMVDSAVGGKTALNLALGKNLVGTVHPATLVVIDVDFAASLPEPEFRSGLAEAVKMGIGLDRELFRMLEQQGDRVRRREPDALLAVVERALAAKIAIVEGDLREHGRRRLLNLGHTLGHAIEAHAAGRLPHGLCVARGLWFALELAHDLGALAAVDRERGEALLRACGFARDPIPPADALMPFLARDKKVAAGTVQFALPTGIGTSEVRPLSLDRVRAQLDRG
ncbi:MAG: 3-dehydroquinate synthase family protein [Planctomycetota bacterium]